MARQTKTAAPKTKYRATRTCQVCRGVLVLTRNAAGKLEFRCDDCG